MQLKEELESNTIIVKDLNTLLSTMDHADRKSISKLNLNNI